MLLSVPRRASRRGRPARRRGDRRDRRVARARVAEEPSSAVDPGSSGPLRARQRGDLGGGGGRLPRGRPPRPVQRRLARFAEATFDALLARDRDARGAGPAGAARPRGRTRRSPGLQHRVGEAGIAALDGQVGCGAGRASDSVCRAPGDRGIPEAGAHWAGHGDPARLGDAQVQAAIAESRQLFERMGAGLWLARLDGAAAAEVSAQRRSARRRTHAGPEVAAENPRVPADG